jgi:hypothetical protein
MSFERTLELWLQLQLETRVVTTATKLKIIVTSLRQDSWTVSSFVAVVTTRVVGSCICNRGLTSNLTVLLSNEQHPLTDILPSRKNGYANGYSRAVDETQASTDDHRAPVVDPPIHFPTVSGPDGLH